MNFGKSYFTQTASIYDNIPSSSAPTKSLVNNKNTKYVETINSNSVNLKGYAFYETIGWYSSSNSFPNDNDYGRDIIARKNIFGYAYSTAAYSTYQGATFRPVIWNAQTK